MPYRNFFVPSASSSDVDAETERQLLRESESELSETELARESCGSFSVCEINSVKYWRVVKRILVKRMQTSTPLSGRHYLSHCQMYDKWGKKVRRPAPEYDAWMCVRGESREVFDVKGFLKRYPSVHAYILDIRKSCKLSFKNKYDGK